VPRFSAITLHAYVEDVDAFASAAVSAGATLERAPADQFYGDRIAVLRDPFGHRWMFATRLETLSGEEMKKRMSAL